VNAAEQRGAEPALGSALAQCLHLDVFAHEPPSPDSPLPDSPLRALEQVIVTPR